MSEPDKSGEPTPASADLPAAAPQTPASPNAPAFGVFSPTKGAGLARGKRPSAAAAATTRPVPAAGYKPTSLEVMKPVSEYKNPFTGETTVSAPEAPVSASAPDIEPAPAAVPVQPSPVPDSSASIDASTASNGETTATPAPAPVAESTARPELNILPPEPSKRPDVRWESPSASAGAEPAQRPTFQPREKREQFPYEPREGGAPREPRAPRDSREPRESRGFDPRDARGPRPFEPRAPREPRRDDRRFEPRATAPQPEAAPAKPKR